MSSLSVVVVVVVVSAAFCIVNEDIGRRSDLDAGANAYDDDDESSVMTTKSSGVSYDMKIMSPPV
jgi:hypothetical protein